MIPAPRCRRAKASDHVTDEAEAGPLTIRPVSHPATKPTNNMTSGLSLARYIAIFVVAGVICGSTRPSQMRCDCRALCLSCMIRIRRRRQPCPQIAKADGLIGLNGLLQFHDAERPAKRERQDDRTTRTEQAVKGVASRRGKEPSVAILRAGAVYHGVCTPKLPVTSPSFRQ
jgi:hypothetical protein